MTDITLTISIDASKTTAGQLERILEVIDEYIARDPRAVTLPLEQWDTVIMALEEEIDQLHGPVGTEPNDLQEEGIEALEEAYGSIMEQVTEGDDG